MTRTRVSARLCTGGIAQRLSLRKLVRRKAADIPMDQDAAPVKLEVSTDLLLKCL
jgi:hypothetical protein